MIPLSLGYSKARSSAVNDGECINVYPCVNPSGSKSQLTLSERPGLKQWEQPSGSTGQVRALHSREGLIYSVVGNKFYETNKSTLVSTERGTLVNDTGKAWIESNANSQILIATNDLGYLYNWGTHDFAQIADGDFPGARSLTFQDNYAVTVDPDSGRLRNCEINDFSDWVSTAFVTAEAAPDNLVAVLSDHQEIFGFGEDTVEIFATSGDASAVFQRLSGRMIEVGIGAAGSVAKITDVLFWLDNSLQVRMAEVYRSTIVSSDFLTYQLKQLGTTDDALGFSFVWNGHAFYGLTFPTANKTFVYDITSSAKSGVSLWHELRSYPVESENKWRGNVVLQDGKDVYAGDYENGWIYTLDEDTHTDNDTAMQRIWTTAEVFDPQLRRNMFHHILELEVQPGVGTLAVPDPEVAMSYSDDGGRTWSSELFYTIDIGGIGEYQNRAKWDGLGASRNRIYKFLVADDVKLDIVGVYLWASIGTH